MNKIMTEADVRAASKEKIDKVKALCDELHVTLDAKNRLDPMSMFMEPIVVFNDTEQYPMEKAKGDSPVLERGNESGPAEGTVVPENTQPEPNEDTNTQQ